MARTQTWVDSWFPGQEIPGPVEIPLPIPPPNPNPPEVPAPPVPPGPGTSISSTNASTSTPTPVVPAAAPIPTPASPAPGTTTPTPTPATPAPGGYTSAQIVKMTPVERASAGILPAALAKAKADVYAVEHPADAQAKADMSNATNPTAAQPYFGEGVKAKDSTTTPSTPGTPGASGTPGAVAPPPMATPSTPALPGKVESPTASTDIKAPTDEIYVPENITKDQTVPYKSPLASGEPPLGSPYSLLFGGGKEIVKPEDRTQVIPGKVTPGFKSTLAEQRGDVNQRRAASLVVEDPTQSIEAKAAAAKAKADADAQVRADAKAKADAAAAVAAANAAQQAGFWAQYEINKKVREGTWG